MPHTAAFISVKAMDGARGFKGIFAERWCPLVSAVPDNNFCRYLIAKRDLAAQLITSGGCRAKMNVADRTTQFAQHIDKIGDLGSSQYTWIK